MVAPLGRGRLLPELRRILAAAILAATVAVGGEKGRQRSVLVKAIEQRDDNRQAATV